MTLSLLIMVFMFVVEVTSSFRIRFSFSLLFNLWVSLCVWVRFGQYLFIPQHHFKDTPHPLPDHNFNFSVCLLEASYTQRRRPNLCSWCPLHSVNADLLSSNSTVVFRCLTVSHGYHYLPEDDLSGRPESVQLRGGGKPGCHQNTFGQV